MQKSSRVYPPPPRRVSWKKVGRREGMFSASGSIPLPPSSASSLPFHPPRFAPVFEESFRGNLLEPDSSNFSLYIRNKLSVLDQAIVLEEVSSWGSIARIHSRDSPWKLLQPILFFFGRGFFFSSKGTRWRRRNEVEGIVKERGWKKHYGRFRSISSKQFYSGRVTHKRTHEMGICNSSGKRSLRDPYFCHCYKYSFLHVMRKIRSVYFSYLNGFIN